MAVERYVDKQIRMFEAILADSQVEGQFNILSEDASVNGEQFRKMLSSLEVLKLIELEGIWEIPFENDIGYEITSPDYLIATLKILDRPELEKQLTDLKKSYPKKTKPLLRPQATELIARAIGDIASGQKLQGLLESFGVDKTLIIYPNTKWRMVQDVLDYLLMSNRPEDVSALENIFREFCHPLMHGGDTERAKGFEKKLNGWVEYEGYRVVRGKLIDLADKREDESPLNDFLNESGYADVMRENAKNKKDIQAIIDEEKKQIAGMVALPELEVINVAWDSYKKVLDQISFSIPRIANTIPVVSTNFTALKLSTDRIEEVMKNMLDSGVFSYPIPKNSIVTTSEPIRRFLAGQDIIVKNVERFREVRKQTDELISSIAKRRDELLKITNSGSKLAEAIQGAVHGLQLPEMSEYKPYILPPSPQRVILDVEVERRAYTEKLSGQQMREKLKNDRIIAERAVPLKQHVLRTILEELENFGNRVDAVDIDFFHFNFESNRHGISRFEKFLDRLKSEGYLQGYTRISRPIQGSCYSFTGIDKERMKGFLLAENTKTSDASASMQQSVIPVSNQALPEKANPKSGRGSVSISAPILAKLSQAKTWEQIRFEFVEGGDFVDIYIQDKIVDKYNYEDLGFRDNRKNHAWLKSWAMLALMGMEKGFLKYEDKHQPTKSDLQRRIKNLFPNILGNPIECDDRNHQYCCVFKVVDKLDKRNAFIEEKAEKRPSEFLGRVGN